MLRNAVSAFALIAALGACAHNPPVEAPAENLVVATVETPEEQSKRLNEWFDVKYEEFLQLSPLQLTFLGRKDKNDEFDCFTLECQDDQLAMMKAANDEMKSSFNYETLSAEDKLSYDLFDYQYQQSAKSAKFRYNGFFYDQMNGPQGFIPTFLIKSNVPTIASV